MKFAIEQIWIDDDALDKSLTRTILRELGSAQILTGAEAVEARRALELAPDPFARGKKILWLKRHRGAFLKPCPGTPDYICCGLQILHIGQGCPMDCRYCALQAYFNRSVLEMFVNEDEMLEQLEAFLLDNEERPLRICTGEFTDSLALDNLTGLASRLVRVFSAQTNASLELKTKTDFIEPLLGLNPRGRVVLSFSVNSRQVARMEERRAVSLEKRLRAAALAHEHGYRIGFHFDPIIPTPGWEDEYSETIDALFRAVDPAALAWISLGALRFVPALKETVTHRFGPIPYFHEAFVRGFDGKSRLEVSRRIRIYRFLGDRIRRHAPDAKIYLCMESPHVWKESLDIRMESNEDLCAYLDEAVSSGDRKEARERR